MSSSWAPAPRDSLLRARFNLRVWTSSCSARERVGGRIFTHRGDTPLPLELGAEFIHGRAPAVRGVLREAGLASVDVEGCRFASNARGTLRPLDDFWEQLDRIMRRLPHRRARDRSFQEFLDTRPGGARLADQRALAKQWVEGFHAADTKRISAPRVGEPGAIEFVPSLRQKQSALDCLEAGSVARVTLRLRERVWAEKYPTLSFVHSSDEDFPVWWTAYPVQAPIVTGWRGGPGARRLAQLPPGELERRAIAALGRRLRLSDRRMRSLVEAVWTHDWEHDPFARGAYSYQVVGGDGTPAALARPLRRTLFFAGEATDTEGATGTVDGAIASGRRAAAQVRRALGQ